MASSSHLDDDDDFGGDFPESSNRSGHKRGFDDLDDDDDEDDFFGSTRGKAKAEETTPGVATGMILSLRESLQSCKDMLKTYQTELDAAKSEVQRWHSVFQNEPALATGSFSEPALAIRYLHTLKSSEVLLKEQLKKAKEKEAAFGITFAKREQEISDSKFTVRDLKAQLKPPSMKERKLLLDPAIYEEFTRLQNLIEEKNKKVKELEDSVEAVNYTPQSKYGKMLMAKCRRLQEENEDIGTLASEGKVLVYLAKPEAKIHELSMKLAMQKSENAEIRNQFEGLHEHVEGLTNEVEKSDAMVLMLQETLEKKGSELRRLKDELYQKRRIEEEMRVSADKNVAECLKLEESKKEM